MSKSPCSKCECKTECTSKVERSPKLGAIVDLMLCGNTPKEDCGIYIAINADPDEVVERLCGDG